MDKPPLVLVPGFWLGGWAWDAVAADLRAHGHETTAVTLPGLSADATDRAVITWSDQVDALAAVVARTGPDTVLVAHSGGGAIATGVIDRDPDAVRRVIWVDRGPSAADPDEGAGPAAELAELPLPDFADLAAEGTSLAGLSDDDLAAFRARAVPQPGKAARGPVVLHDDRRRKVPSTLIACSFPAVQVQKLAAAGHPMFAELGRFSDVTFVDLPTGHWPMFSRPRDLAEQLRIAATTT